VLAAGTNYQLLGRQHRWRSENDAMLAVSNMAKFLLEELRVYKMAEDLADLIWEAVVS
jgi:hypothetical protein